MFGSATERDPFRIIRNPGTRGISVRPTTWRMDVTNLKKVIAELGRSGFLAPPSGRKVQQKPTSVFYSEQVPAVQESFYQQPAEEQAISNDSQPASNTSNEQQDLVDRVPFSQPQYYSATLATPTRRPPRPQVTTRPYKDDDFASAVLARTQVTLGQRLSSSVEPCSGQCGNIMCSLTANSTEEELSERAQEGATELTAQPSECLSSIPKEQSPVELSDFPDETTQASGMENNVPSPLLERRSKSGVLGKIRSLTNRSSYSTSEEGHSQSSDCEDIEETRLGSRDSGTRVSSTSFAGRVRDLHRDVKRRISKLRGSSRSNENENSRENEEGLHEAESSMESIPSGSAGSRSSLQAHTPTSSNRSSSSAGEDDPSSVIGPILGRARALVDVTPSPYDRDGLALKKGDVIDIIAKNNTGTWVGVVHGKVGHFKFINVQEIPMESKSRRRQRRSKQSKPNEASESIVEAGPADTRWQPETLQQLLEVHGLQDCMNVLMLHGYGDLDTFREIEKDDLISLGITSPSLQKRLLRAAEMLFDEDDMEESEECPNSLDTLVGQNGHPSLNSQISSDTVISTNNLDEGVPSSNNCANEMESNNCEEKYNPSEFRPNIPIGEPNESSLASTVPQNSMEDHGHFNSMDRNEEDPESTLDLLRTTAQILKNSSSAYEAEDLYNGRYPLIAEQISNKNSRGKAPPPIPKRTTPIITRPSKFSAGVLEVNCNGGTMHYPRSNSEDYGVAVSEETRAKSATLPRKKVTDANEEYEINAQPIEKSEHHHSMGTRLLEKKLYKKFGQRKGSLQVQPLKNPRPPSLSLLTAVYRKLEDEGIDLAVEPYTDKTGFCGIPPALVQRYAEELQRDVYDVAESMDQARINALQMRGRRGVPNDFLADACYGPVVEANYSGTLRDWLVSLGLPMYEDNLRVASSTNGGNATHHMERVAHLRDSDLREFGVRNARHVRLLTTAIGALNIHLGRLGGVC